MGAVKEGDGYGLLKHGGRTRLAHRVMWELARGPIPPGKVLMHRCDITCCLNPDHLSIGTQLENELDKVQKGRQKKTLSDQQVLAIRADPRSTRAIARDYSITSTTVSQIKRLARRKHVT